MIRVSDRRGAIVLASIVVVAYSLWVRWLTPAGATSLFWVELSFTPGNFAESIRTWIAPAAQTQPVVVSSAALAWFRYGVMGGDFLFIPAYVVVLSALYRWLERSIGRQPLAVPIAIAVVAGALDVLENIGLLWLTTGLTMRSISADAFPAVAVTTMSTFSALKWAAVALVAVFIVRALFGAERGQVVLLSRYSVLSLLLGTLPLVKTGQGQDLLAALAEASSTWHRAFFFGALALWGVSVWYWSRVLLDAHLAGTRGAHYAGLARHLPRILGIVTLLAPAGALWTASAPWPDRLYLIGGCVSLTAIFFAAVLKRRDALRGRTAFGPLAFHVAAASAIVSLVLFGFLVGTPVAAGQLLGAPAILLIAAANTVFIGSVVVFLSRRTGIAIEVVALVCAALFSFWNDNHDVRVGPIERPMPLPSVHAMFREWAQELRAGSHRHRTDAMPVFLIAAEGGGIRAAYWTATVLGALNDAAPDEFARHVFAINGISGGSLGAAVYASLRRDAPGPTIRRTATALMGRGYLAPVMSRLVTGDLLQWFIPFPIQAFDRSRAMEESFADSYVAANPAFPNRFDQPFLALTPSASAGVPALVLSATSVESGARMLVAPFSWSMYDLPDAHDYHYETDGDPTLAAAVNNSARFTYVSPAGRVRTQIGSADRGHVIDGGYFDPSGVETILDLRLALDDVARQEHVTLVTIFITNAVVPDDLRPAVIPKASAAYEGHLQPLEILGEVFAPVRGVLRARDAHGRLAGARHQELSASTTFGFCEAHSEDADRLQPPLGWELSRSMAARLDALWDQCTPNADRSAALLRLIQ